MSQFEPRWDPLVLLQVIPRVLRQADPEHPERVSQRMYNDARATAGYPDSPRADKLAAKFGVSWTRLVKVVITENSPVSVLAKAHGVGRQQRRSEMEVVSAIKTAAAWLGTDHLNVGSYERARAAINARARRHHLHGLGFAALPAVGTITIRMSFADAVAAAGLRTSPRQSAPAMSRREIVQLVVEHCGFTPRRSDVEHFARHHDIRLASSHTSPPYATILADVRTEFERQGHKFPRTGRNTVPDDWRQRIEADSEAVRAAQARYPSVRDHGYTLDEVFASVRAAFDLIEPGQWLTYGDLQRTANAARPSRADEIHAETRQTPRDDVD